MFQVFGFFYDVWGFVCVLLFVCLFVCWCVCLFVCLFGDGGEGVSVYLGASKHYLCENVVRDSTVFIVLVICHLMYYTGLVRIKKHHCLILD